MDVLISDMQIQLLRMFVYEKLKVNFNLRDYSRRIKFTRPNVYDGTFLPVAC